MKMTPVPKSKKTLKAAVKPTAAFLIVGSASYYFYTVNRHSPTQLSRIPILKTLTKGVSNNLPTTTQGSKATQVSVTTILTPTPAPTELTIEDEGNHS